jgi:hypothetical protein
VEHRVPPALRLSNGRRVNLSVMTNIDSDGRQVIKRMHISGVRPVGPGVMTRAVIEEITRSD